MAAQSSIEWTDATWNPIVGCSIVLPGCINCYAMRMAAQINKMTLSSHYKGLTEKAANGKQIWTSKIAQAPHQILTAPLCWKKPRRIFVNSMGDLFHESIPDKWIDRVFAVMALCPQHTFQVLTKRADRMREYVGKRHSRNEVELAAEHIKPSKGFPVSPKWCFEWPLPSVWLGISAERQQEADERIPLLMQAPAAVRFVSAEPLLASIDLTSLKIARAYGTFLFDATTGASRDHHGMPFSSSVDGKRLNWVIVGGESGPHARPMHPDWARSLRDQCAAAGVPFFFKQFGEFASGCHHMGTGEMVFRQFASFDHWVNKASTWVNGGICLDKNGLELRDGAAFMTARDAGHFPVTIMHRVGKKTAGRLLDGVEHSAFPANS